MKVKRSTEIKVGLVTISAIVIFIIGISLGKGYRVTASSNVIQMMFPNSGGIQVSEPVVVNGVKRGSVNSVENKDNGVLIKVELDYIDDLKEDASAIITILELTGGKKIEIDPGSSTEKFLPDMVIPGETPPDIGRLVAIVGSVSQQAVSIINRLDTMASSINTLLADETFIENIKLTINNTARISTEMNDMLSENGELKKSLSNLSILARDLKDAVKENRPQAVKLLKDIEIVINDTRNMIKNADGVFRNADTLINSINTIASDVKTGNGLVSKVLYDKSMALRLDSTLIQLDTFIRQVRKYGINTNVSIGRKP